ncbi:MAG: hypothetical protein JWM32_1276 [Verrucomicrobia bacterium]|nr:hypothetical protein [Verrucomicrobiota bacterium]
MKLNAEFFMSPTGQLVVIGALLLLGGSVFAWQQRAKTSATKPASHDPTPKPLALPVAFVRDVARLPKPAPLPSPAPVPKPIFTPPPVPMPPKPTALPLSFGSGVIKSKPGSEKLSAPYGRMIPCETVVTLESNRLETPVIGLVTEDVWHDGQRIIPAGAEVHGKASLDRSRERLAVEGAWHIVWRTGDHENGTELSVSGLALDRDEEAGTWGEHDGSAGLRGLVLKTGDDRELKLFAATFLGTATAALQDTQTLGGAFGQSAIPVATVRNAALSGLSAIMREYAQTLKEAITRDGFYLRVPAGKPFYLYVTQPIERHPTPTTATTASTP